MCLKTGNKTSDRKMREFEKNQTDISIEIYYVRLFFSNFPFISNTVIFSTFSTYFVEYQFPVVAASRSRRQPSAAATEVMRVVSKKVSDNGN